MEYREKFIKDKIEKIKEMTRPVDARPLMKFMLESGGKLSEGEKKEFLSKLNEGFDEAGKLFLDRCFTEGVMLEKEYLEIKEKYCLEDTDFGVVLQAYFLKKDGVLNLEEKAVIATMPHSNIFKCRDFILKRFGVVVLSAEECIKVMYEELVKKGMK